MRLKIWQTGVAGAIFGLALAFGASGCKGSNNLVTNANNGPDPAAANEAPVTDTTATPSGTTSQPTKVMGTSASAPESANSENYQDNYQDADYDQSQADAGQAAIYADQAPPPLPDYDQPELTEPGYIWTPGYWSWGPGGYYWVPGAWVAPPYEGALWTPGYWGYYGGRYGFHRGYWARHIGFYGGINYGFGYVGFGYQGGYWNGNQFYYNNQVNRVNVDAVHTVYQRNVAANNNTRVSFNGPNGVRVAPRPQELAVLHEQRVPPMQVQQQRAQQAAQNRQQFYAENHGKPAIAAAPEHLAADRTPPQPIRQGAAAPAQRAGFGQTNAANQRQAQVQQQQQAHEQQQQRTQQLAQQHNAQVQQQQQAREQQQQRTQQLNQQHNAQVQQQQQAREQQQQRTQQLNQQHNAQVEQQQHQVQQHQQEQRPATAPPRVETRPQPAPQARPQPAPRPQAAPHPAPAPQKDEHPR
jgi:hypothetical protein